MNAVAEAVEFRPADHTYWLAGKEYPSVTTILKRVLGDPFAGVPRATLERARHLGSAVHRACELDDRGELDGYDVIEEVMQRVRQWRRFRQQWGAHRFLFIEEPRVNIKLGLAGTADRIGFKGASEVPFCLDLKGRSESVYVGLQTAGYCLLYGLPISTGRWALYLDEDRYTLEPCTNLNDFADFAAILRVHALMQRQRQP